MKVTRGTLKANGEVVPSGTPLSQLPEEVAALVEEVGTFEEVPDPPKPKAKAKPRTTKKTEGK